MKKFIGVLFVVSFLCGSSYAASTLPPDCIMVTKWSHEFLEAAGPDLLSVDEAVAKQLETTGERILVVGTKIFQKMVKDSGIVLKDTIKTGANFVILYGTAIVMMIEHLAKTVAVTAEGLADVGANMIILGKDTISDLGKILANWLSIAGLNLQIIYYKTADFLQTEAAKMILATGLALATVAGTLMAYTYKGIEALKNFVLGFNEAFLLINVRLAAVVVTIDLYLHTFLQSAIAFATENASKGLKYLQLKEQILADKVIQKQEMVKASKQAKIDFLKLNFGKAASEILAKIPECKSGADCGVYPLNRF